MRSAETSRMTTSWPRSARQAPLTSPAYPAPKKAILAMGARLLAADGLQALGDRDHRLVGDVVEQGVRHPVGDALLAEHDHVDLGAVVVEVVQPAADAVAGALVGQHRRVGPVGLLHAPVRAAGGAED